TRSGSEVSQHKSKASKKDELDSKEVVTSIQSKEGGSVTLDWEIWINHIYRKANYREKANDDSEAPDEPHRHVLVIGATNKPNAIDSSLRRPGRFDPTSTSGFVGADLEALANEAGIVAMNRICNEMKFKLSQDLTNEPDEDSWKKPLLHENDIEKCAITMSDFEEAIKMVQPSLTREGFAAIPNVKWEDVGALDHVREVFDNYILKRMKHPDDYK
ncbi:cell division control protein 48 c-like, partial [Trifolium pratense]